MHTPTCTETCIHPHTCMYTRTSYGISASLINVRFTFPQVNPCNGWMSANKTLRTLTSEVELLPLPLCLLQTLFLRRMGFYSRMVTSLANNKLSHLGSQRSQKDLRVLLPPPLSMATSLAVYLQGTCFSCANMYTHTACKMI